MKLRLKLFALALALMPTGALAQGMLGPTVTPPYGIGSNPNSQLVQPRPTNPYAQPYHRTVPNNTQLDNYNTKGNVNPYTGAVGTRQPRY